MLESEAKTKWCPLARELSYMLTPSAPQTLYGVYGVRVDTPTSIMPGASGINRNPSAPYIARCLGSECTAWISYTKGGEFIEPCEGRCGAFNNGRDQHRTS